MNWAGLVDTDDVDVYIVTIMRDSELRDAACFPVCVYPATEKFLGVEICRRRIE